MTKRLVTFAGAALLGLTSLSAQAIPTLFDYGFNIDGAVTMNAAAGGLDISTFDDITGLGAITATISGAGAHTFDAFFDHEFVESMNSFFNEFGTVSGVAASGQSWEIDEPGFVFGDIYDNFSNSTLDNSNSVPAGLEDDVSMAMGWDFTLAAGEIATISLSLTDILPTGFFLSHIDPDSNDGLYLSSALNISGTPVPEPPMIYLLGLGLAGMVVIRRKVKGA